MNNVTSATGKPEEPMVLREAYEYRLQKLKELKATLKWEKVSPTKDANLSPAEQEKIDKAYKIINEHRLQARLKKNTAKVAELEKDPVYQEAKAVMKKAKLTRDQLAALQGISLEKAKAFLYGKPPKKSIDKTAPANVLEYRKGRETGIQGIDTEKKKNIAEVAEKMIAEKKFCFEQRAGLGDFATFTLEGLNGGNKRGICDASSLIQPEKDVTNTVDYTEYGAWVPITRENICLQVMRGKNPQDWKKSNIRDIVTTAQKQYNVGLPSEEKMKSLLTALGNYYQKEKNQSLSESEQIALFMYLTGYYGWYRLENYGEQDKASRSSLKCHAGNRRFYRDYYGYFNAGYLLSD